MKIGSRYQISSYIRLLLKTKSYLITRIIETKVRSKQYGNNGLTIYIIITLPSTFYKLIYFVEIFIFLFYDKKSNSIDQESIYNNPVLS